MILTITFQFYGFGGLRKKKLRNLTDAPLKLTNQLANQSSKAISKRKKKEV